MHVIIYALVLSRRPRRIMNIRSLKGNGAMLSKVFHDTHSQVNCCMVRGDQQKPSYAGLDLTCGLLDISPITFSKEQKAKHVIRYAILPAVENQNQTGD